jgi:hypothetical protein
MANGSGAAFDGDGSVRWEVHTCDDAEHDHRGNKWKCVDVAREDRPHGRRNAGVDKFGRGEFTITLKVPEAGSQRSAFLRQFATGAVHGDLVVISLPIARVANQVEIQWDGSDPTGDAGNKEVRDGER